MPSHPRSAPVSLATNTSSNTSNKAHNANNNGNPRRSSASTAPPAVPSTLAGIQILKNPQGFQGTTKQSNIDQPPPRNQRAQPSGHKQKSPSLPQTAPAQQESQGSNSPGSKGKRHQRRKDTEGNVDLAKAETEPTALNQSPPLNPSSPPSTDSDDSESAVHRPVPHPRPAKANKQSGRPGKGSGPLSASPPQRPSSAPAMPQPRKSGNSGVALPQRQQNTNAGNTSQQQQQHQRHSGSSGKPSPDRAADVSSDPTDSQLRPNVAKAISADKVMLADRMVVDKKAGLYAGPTFHNSPAPASLPIPAFAKPCNSIAPTELSLDHLPSTPFFSDGASPHLNSMRPQRAQSEPTGWTAHHSLPGMPSTPGPYYHMPDYLASPYISDAHGTDQLMEISQNLRNLLKIQSQ
ncbi:hypothetical protein BGX34_001114 [Mortierella sp. NVP85]|nr:hypothetical protein BGX34_001114 [Mortierella sp. NVP85]